MAEPRSALGRLVASLVVDSAEFTSGLSKSEAELAKFQRGVDAKLAAVERRFSGMAKAFGAGLAAAFSVDAIKQKIGGAIDALDEVNKFSERTGLATEEVQKFGYIAKLQETNIEAFSTGVKKLSVNLSAAIGGSREQSQVFQSLGVKLTEAGGKARSTTDVFGDLAEVFKNLPEGPERAALAVKLFGKSGDELIPVLNLGRDGIRRMGEEATAFGLVTGPAAVKQAAEFKDNLDRLKAASNGAAQAFVAGILPKLVEVSDRLVDAAKNGRLLQAVFEELEAQRQSTVASASQRILESFDEEAKRIANRFGAQPGSFVSDKFQREANQAAAETIRLMREQRAIALDQEGAETRRLARQDALVATGHEINALEKARNALRSQDTLSGRNEALEFYFNQLKQINLEEERNLAILKDGRPLDAERQTALEREAALIEKIAKLKRQGVTFDPNLASNLRGAIRRGEATAKETREQAELRELQKQYNEQRQEEVRRDIEQARSTRAQTVEIEHQIEAVGKTRSEVERLTRAWEDEAIAGKRSDLRLTELDGNPTKAIEREIELLEKRAELRRRQAVDTNDQLFNPLRGAKDAIDEYMDHVEQAGARTKEAITGSLGTLQSTLEEFFTTGKFGFKEFITSIQREFARLASEQIIRQIIGLAAGGGAFAANTTAFAYPAASAAATLFHSGGIVGAEGRGVSVNASMFQRAPRFHGGLMPNEFPAILQKGEGVFTKAQMKAMGGRSVNIVNNNNFSTGVPVAAMAAYAQQIKTATKAAIADDAYRRIGG